MPPPAMKVKNLICAPASFSAEDSRCLLNVPAEGLGPEDRGLISKEMWDIKQTGWPSLLGSRCLVEARAWVRKDQARWTAVGLCCSRSVTPAVCVSTRLCQPAPPSFRVGTCPALTGTAATSDFSESHFYVLPPLKFRF